MSLPFSDQSEQEASFDKEKQRLESWIKQRLKKLEKQKVQFTKEYARSLDWQKFQHEATLLQANFYKIKKGLSSITLSDWEDEGREKIIALDPLQDPKEDLANRFKKSKKLKNGLEPLKKLLEKNQKKIEEWLLFLAEAAQVNDHESLLKMQQKVDFPKEVIPKTKAKPEKKAQNPYHSFCSESGWHARRVKKGKTETDHADSSNVTSKREKAMRASTPPSANAVGIPTEVHSQPKMRLAGSAATPATIA